MRSTGASPANGGLLVSLPHLSMRLTLDRPSCLYSNVQNMALGWLQVSAALDPGQESKTPEHRAHGLCVHGFERPSLAIHK